MSQLAEIESIQPDVFAYVSADSYLAKVSKFEIRLERVQTLIDEALSEGTFDPSQAGVLPGAVIEVLMPMVKTENPNAPGPLCTVEQRFIVKENPTVNLAVDENNNPLGTNLTAEMIAARLVRIMHQWGIAGVKTSWYAAPDCITPNRDYLPLVAYDVVVYCTMQFTPLPRAATPTITEPESLTVALACATEGASIYYTTDTSAPWSGNPAAVLYTVPFTVASGTVVRFAAFAANYIGSAFCRATIT